MVLIADLIFVSDNSNISAILHLAYVDYIKYETLKFFCTCPEIRREEIRREDCWDPNDPASPLPYLVFSKLKCFKVNPRFQIILLHIISVNIFNKFYF